VKLVDHSVADLLAAFRSSSPTPGGGSASALSGAVGASLLAMVAGLPKSKADTDADRGRLSAAGARCAVLADVLASLIDRDSEAYDRVVSAYKKPKTSDEEKAARSSAIQEALQSAIDAPLSVMRACADALEQAVTIGELGNASASSDVQVALELLGAGLRGARQNVEINLGSVKDAAYADAVRGEATRCALTGAGHSGAARGALGSQPQA
jgi:formiminotetrahydrofolate cyclodeaminase